MSLYIQFSKGTKKGVCIYKPIVMEKSDEHDTSLNLKCAHTHTVVCSLTG